MGATIAIAVRKRLHAWRRHRYPFRLVLDTAPLVFLTGRADAATVAETAHRLSELGLELRAAIGLDELHRAVEASGQARLQERAASLL